MSRFATVADRDAVQAEKPYEDRDEPKTMHAFLDRVAKRTPNGKAVSFQLLSDPKSKSETLTWAQLQSEAIRAANLFRRLGVGETDAVAYVLPNSNETAIALLGGMIAGIINPINPLLDAEHIAGIINETGAKVVVTMKAFPKSDIAQKMAEVLKHTPNVKHVLEIDLKRYLSPPKSWIIPLVRPKNPVEHKIPVSDFNALRAREAATLAFPDSEGDRICAYFHTGGTTGLPKVARHRYSGAVYNGWLGGTLLFDDTDVLICPLPMFHVFAVYPILMSAIHSGAHVVFPTPAGYRGEGVFDNFWKLIERWHVTFMITVPTALSALMQRPVDADVSSLRTAISGSSPLALELYNRFERATGVQIAEGYGLTEATCLVSCNPIEGVKKVGSVGIPLPYSDVKILNCAPDGAIIRECGVDEIGEICVSNFGVFRGQTYQEAAKNQGLYAGGTHLRTGDLGRIDADGYLWITGRAKDLIIRGGHNIDPAMIEEALMKHEAVAIVGAIGQPDAHAGELPCAYVELVKGAIVTPEELMAYAALHVPERAAHPKHVEILPELPKTAVGKILKNDLRKLAIRRVFGDALTAAGLAAEVTEVYEDKKRGLVAKLNRTGAVDDALVQKTLGVFTNGWEWGDA